MQDDKKLQAALAYIGTKFDSLEELVKYIAGREFPKTEPTDLTATNELLQQLIDKKNDDIEVTLDIV